MTDATEIPPCRSPEDMPPLVTQTDLYDAWRSLMGPLGFGRRSLWLLLIDDADRALPVLIPIDYIPTQPEDLMVDRLAGICERLIEEHVPDGSVAMLLSRPGRHGITDSDRRWARALYAASDDRFALRPLHLATDDRLIALTRDDAGSLVG